MSSGLLYLLRPLIEDATPPTAVSAFIFSARQYILETVAHCAVSAANARHVGQFSFLKTTQS